MARSRGMTLVELLAAMAIASMLCASAVAVATQASRSSILPQQAHEESSLHDQLKALLEADLTHAVKCRTTETGFVLQTYSALDGDSLELSHLPSVVAYEVRKAQPRNVLVRTQQTAYGQKVCQLVCSCVAAVGLEGAGEAGPDGWRDAPVAVTVVLKFQEATKKTKRFSWRTE